MQCMIRARPNCHDVALAFATVFCSYVSHHPHPLATHISSRIGPAKMQARRSRAIRRDGFMKIRMSMAVRNVK